VVFVVVLVAHLASLYWPRIGIEGPVTWTDKVVHVLLFLAPTVTGLLAGVRPAYLVGLLALHAPVSELVQHYLLPNRSGDVWDAVADLSGVVLGVTSVVVGRALRR
jgi:VanZ family protein